MWTLITGFFSKYLIYLILAAVVAGSGATVYLSIVHNAAQEQLMKDKFADEEAVIQNQDTQIQNLNGIIVQNNEAITALNDQIASIKQQFGIIQDSLNDPDVIKQDHPSSDILKNIIKQLGGQ